MCLTLLHSMIELRTLGTLSLHSDDGAEIRAVLVQPKRLALLAYLALREPAGFHQRSTLLPVFWPESDETRARLALRSALHALRGALGTDVVIGRGDEGVGLDPQRFRCDAVELERALAEGRREDALPLYSGTLLEGLSVTELPAFDEWLDARRDSLKRRVFDAAMELADERESAGRARDALALVRRAGELMPYDETVIRREMSLLAGLGDRAMALAAYDAWSQRLERELELRPSPETAGLAERVRAARSEPVTTQVAERAAVVSPTDAAPPLAPPLVAQRRGAPILAMAGIVVAVLAMAAFWWRGSPKGSIEPRSAQARADLANAERLEAAGEYAGALEAYRRVVGAEPGFARGQYGKSIAAQWAGETDTAVAAARRAAELSDRLPPNERASLGAWQALLDTRLGAAARLYEAQLQQYPEDARSWVQLGEIRYHWGSAFGVAPSSAIEPFQQALRLQSSNGAAFIHLARLEGRSARVASLDSLMERGSVQTVSAAERLELRALQAALHDDASARVRLLGEAVAKGPAATLPLMSLVAPIDTGMTTALAHALTTRSNKPDVRALGYVALANVELARGHATSASTWLDSLTVEQRAPGAEYRAVFATLPWRAADTAACRAALRAIEMIPPQRAVSNEIRGDVGLARSEIQTIRRLYLTALLRSRLGDAAGAEADVRALEQFPNADAIDAADSRELAATVRADWALRDGDAARALALLGEPGSRLDGSLPDFSAYPKARRRFLRAEALARLGRTLDAVSWYSTFPDPSSYDLVYVGPALLGASRGYARLGNRSLADSLARLARTRWP